MEIIKLVLRKTKRITNKIFGTKTDELFWKLRHIFDKKWAEKYISKEAISQAHREFLIERISSYFPFESVLEMGSSAGPNLYLLAKRFPKVKFYGIDISVKAVKTGRKFFIKEKLNNVSLILGKFDDIKKIQDKSMDIVFSDAALIYVGRDKINLIIKEMMRVAKKAIILCEQNSNLSTSFYKDHWIHNYKSLFSKYIPLEKIRMTKLSPEIWSGDWGELGYIIEVDLRI